MPTAALAAGLRAFPRGPWRCCRWGTCGMRASRPRCACRRELRPATRALVSRQQLRQATRKKPGPAGGPWMCWIVRPLHSSLLAQPSCAQHAMTQVLELLGTMCALRAMWRCGAGWFTQEAWQLIHARVCARYWILVEHGPQPEAPMCAPPASIIQCGQSLSHSRLCCCSVMCQRLGVAGVGHKRPHISEHMSTGWVQGERGGCRACGGPDRHGRRRRRAWYSRRARWRQCSCRRRRERCCE